MPEDFDLVVVGAGPAGSVAAALLAGEGFRVALLERAPGPLEKICGEYLGPRAVEELAQAGLAAALEGVPTRPLAGMKIVVPDGTEVIADFVAADGRARHGLAIARPELDGALQQAARRRGAELHFGESVSGIEIASDRVTVTTRRTTWRARMLIGADGRFSVVARALGLSRPARGPRRGVIHAWLRGVSELHDRGEMHLLRDGSYLGLDPLADGRLNAGLVVGAETVADAARSQDGAARLFAAAAGSPALSRRFADASITGEVRYLAPLRTEVRAVVAGRTLLVGDAAGFFDPLTGEGLYLAIASARLAAQQVSTALRHHSTALRHDSTSLRHHSTSLRSGDASIPALAAYARGHRRLVRGKQLFHPLLQGLLRRSSFANHVGRRLQASPAAAERLLAVIGSLRSPMALLHPAFLFPLCAMT